MKDAQMDLSQMKIEHCDQALGALFIESMLHGKLNYKQLYTRQQILDLFQECFNEMKQAQRLNIEQLKQSLSLPVIESNGNEREEITELIKAIA